MPRLKMMVYTNALDGKDDEFNHWYDTIHLPEVIDFTKAVAAQRFQLSDAQPGDPGGHRYLAIYEFEVDSQEAYDSLTASTDKMDLGSSLDSGSAKVVFYDEIGERIGV
jgi:hypothetical protein